MNVNPVKPLLWDQRNPIGEGGGTKLLVLTVLLIQVTMEGKTMLVEFEIKTETFILMYERVAAQFSL